MVETIIPVVAETYVPFLHRAKQHEAALKQIVKDADHCICIIPGDRTCVWCVAQAALEYKW